MKKRISMISGALFLVFSLSACSTNITETKKIEESSVEETAILESIEETQTELVTKEERKVFVSPKYVKNLIDGKLEESKDFIILEASWGDIEFAKDYKKAHIKGAYHLNTDDIESDEYWNLREPDEIAALLKSYGITKDTTVVTYGNSPENTADDRLAVALLWAGVENVKNLSGGIDAYINAGYEIESTINEPVATDKDFGVEIPANPQFILDIDKVKEKMTDDNFKLVSIRSKDEYLGKTSGYSYIDRAGEVPGAIWGHDTDDGSYNNADGSVVDLSVLNKYLLEQGASTTDNELAFYCGTGWRASTPFLIAYENGLDNIYLFDGGWYQWQMDAENKVQLGDPNSSEYKEVFVKDLETNKAKK